MPGLLPSPGSSAIKLLPGKHLITLVIILCIVLLPLCASGEERYQIAPLGDGMGFNPDKALILDTQSGHLWMWIESPPAEGAPGGRYLIYQGQVRPGREMGEVIDKQEWPSAR